MPFLLLSFFSVYLYGLVNPFTDFRYRNNICVPSLSPSHPPSPTHTHKTNKKRNGAIFHCTIKLHFDSVIGFLIRSPHTKHTQTPSHTLPPASSRRLLFTFSVIPSGALAETCFPSAFLCHYIHTAHYGGLTNEQKNRQPNNNKNQNESTRKMARSTIDNQTHNAVSPLYISLASCPTYIISRRYFPFIYPFTSPPDEFLIV